MANETVVCVRGWTAAHPVTFDEVTDAESGEVTRANATIVRIGVTASYYSRQESSYVDGTTNWYSVRTYGNLAINVAKCVSRGVPLLVRGRLVPRSYTNKEGNEVIEQTIIADSVAVDLNTGIAPYSKVSTQALEPVEGERSYDSTETGETEEEREDTAGVLASV